MSRSNDRTQADAPAPSKRNKTARDWCFTSFRSKIISHVVEVYNFEESITLQSGQPEPLEKEAAMWWSTIKANCAYFVAQVKKAPDTGKEHVQGFAVFNDPRRMTGVKTLLDDVSCHVEARQGSREEAATYCKKEESRHIGPIEHGVLMKQGEIPPPIVYVRLDEPAVFIPLSQWERMTARPVHDSAYDDEGNDTDYD